jgi:hypothetical protein
MYPLFHAELAKLRHAEALEIAARRRSAKADRADIELSPATPTDLTEHLPSRAHGRIAGVLGGGAWVLYALIANARPIGCVGDACSTRVMRETGDLDVLLLGGLGLMAVSMAALAMRSRGRAGSRLLTAGSIAAAMGITLTTLGFTVAPAFLSDTTAWGAFVVPGLLAVAAAFALTGAGLTRAATLSAPLGLLVTLGAVALVAANDQDERVLLMLPLALGILTAGIIGPRTRSDEYSKWSLAHVR